jgi:hypothetical protein
MNLDDSEIAGGLALIVVVVLLGGLVLLLGY